MPGGPCHRDLFLSRGWRGCRVFPAAHFLYNIPSCGNDIKLISYRYKLKGGNEKAKANMSSAIGSLINVASNKNITEDFAKKHKSKAEKGWYRYDTRFGIPVYDSDGKILRYDIYKTRMLVRCDSEGKLYLYDFVRTKKETSSPFEQ